MNRVKKLKVTTLGDNLVYHEGHGQSGLSLLLELIDARGEPKKVIFDTGDNKEALMHNIKFLKLNLRDIDTVGFTTISDRHSYSLQTVSCAKPDFQYGFATLDLEVVQCLLCRSTFEYPTKPVIKPTDMVIELFGLFFASMNSGYIFYHRCLRLPYSSTDLKIPVKSPHKYCETTWFLLIDGHKTAKAV